MNYQVLLDRRSVALLAAGFVAVAALLFLAGFLVSARRYHHPRPPRADVARHSPATSQPAPPPLDVAPAETIASSRSYLLPEKAPDALDEPETRAVGSRESARATDPSGQSADSAESRSGLASKKEAPIPPRSYVSANVSFEEEPDAYSVQAGAFLSEFNLESFVDELELLGYRPYVVKLWNEDRILLSVRIGKFSTREEAQRAASAFSASFGRTAVVREPMRP